MLENFDYLLAGCRQDSKRAAESALDSSLDSAFAAANKIENANVRGQILESLVHARASATTLKGLSK